MSYFLKKLNYFLFSLLIILAIVSTVLFNWKNIENLYLKIFDKYPLIARLVDDAQKDLLQIKKQINTPPPLIAQDQSAKAFLTVQGIVEFTNQERVKARLTPLTINNLLTKSAALKVNDMFEKQYFAHESPTGANIEDLAKQAGYEFIVIGENLALGNFLNDKVLVDGWMNSPGHRENILNKNYQEIGIAVLKGNYEGQTTWMAVQHFGTPLSACPQPSQILLDQIKYNQSTLEKLETDILALKSKLSVKNLKKRSEFNQLVVEYNSLVQTYNELASETKKLVDEYNAQVSTFNQCASFN